MTFDLDKMSRELTRYHQSLGQFVTAFARVESVMQLGFHHLLKLHPRQGNAVFSGYKADAIAGLMRRLMDAEEWPQARRDRLEPVLKHLSDINGMRNKILHFGAFWDGQELQVSNAWAIHTDERLWRFSITPETLDDMTFDLNKINEHLFAETMSDVVDVATATRLDAPWRYKSPQLDGPGKRQPEAQSDRIQEPRLPPMPSRG